MALTDRTDGGRIILWASEPMRMVVTAAVKVGDLLTEAGGLAEADAATPAPAVFVAGESAAANATITAYRTCVIQGLTGGTAGLPVFLSDTAGGYSETASTTERQRVGTTLSATEIFVRAERLVERFNIAANVAAADIVGTTAARILYVSTQRVRVTKISEVHAVVAGQAGTATVERLQGTEAPGGGNGDDLLGATKVDLTGTINTVQAPALTGTAANLVLEIGDRLALKLASGAATSLANSQWTVELEVA